MNYLLEYNDKIIGVFNTFQDAELYTLGCIQNNLINHNVKILTFKSNSCYCSEIKNYYDIDDLDKTIDYNQISQTKATLLHELNLLNHEKKKIEEKKNIYNNDLKLYELFKLNQNEIPALFKNKFNIFNKLSDKDQLNIENYFNELYIFEQIENC